MSGWLSLRFIASEEGGREDSLVTIFEKFLLDCSFALELIRLTSIVISERARDREDAS